MAKKITYSEPASYFPKSIMKKIEKKDGAKKTVKKTPKKK